MVRSSIIISAVLVFAFQVVSAGGVNTPIPVSGLSGSKFDPAVSPDGRYIAFTSDEGGDENIWIADLKDQSRRRVTEYSSSEYAPCFINDNKLLFVSTRDNARGEIFSIDIDGGQPRKIIGGEGYYDSPSVSPDGKTAALVHDDNGRPRISFIDLKSKKISRGPFGLDPSFSPFGDKLAFVDLESDSLGSVGLAIYDMSGKTVELIDTGEGLISNPVFSSDGNAIIFASHFTDWNLDGLVTRNDQPELFEISLISDKKTRSLYPGFHFSEPAVSYDGSIFAVSENDVFMLSSSGITVKFTDAIVQASLCDSMIQSTSSYFDTLKTAAVCVASYDYYPDSCGRYLWKAIDYYLALGMSELTIKILKSAEENEDPDFQLKASLSAIGIRFYDNMSVDGDTAWSLAENEIRGIIQNDKSSLEIIKEAYLTGIRLSHAAGRLDDSNSFIIEAMLLFTGHDEFISRLEMWRLRNVASSFKGDLADIAPLYVDYLDRFEDLPELSDSVIGEFLALTRRLDSEIAIVTLDNLSSVYPDYDELGAAFSLEQGRRLEESNRYYQAEWKYEKALEYCRDNPRTRFEIFERLGDIYFKSKDHLTAGAFYDSAGTYLYSVKSLSSKSRFARKKANLLTARGYELLSRDSKRAAGFFREAVTVDINNPFAMWGLARAIGGFGNDDDWKTAGSIFTSESKKEYFKALRHIIEFENDPKISSLRNARKALKRAMELDYQYPLPYLSLGYVDCALEKISGEYSDLFEEAVELSRAGLGLVEGDRYLSSGFRLNLAGAYFGLGQYKSAYENYKKALELDSTITTGDLKSYFFAEFGESGFQIDSLISAQNSFLELYNDAVEQGNIARQAALAGKLGLINQFLGDYLKAVEYYKTALPYYLSRDEFLAAAHLLKAEASSFYQYGNYAAAASSAVLALETLNKAEDRGRLFEDRLKIVFNPLGLEIPIISVGPIIYGNSVYPYGFTEAADRAWLTSIAHFDRDRSETYKRKLSILKRGGEIDMAAGIYNELGLEYFAIGYIDSAASAFVEAFELALGQELYGIAYNYILNLTVAVYSDRLLMEDGNWISVVGEKAADLYNQLLPGDTETKAALSNILGMNRITSALIDLGNVEINGTENLERMLDELDDLAADMRSLMETGRGLFRDGISEVAFGDNSKLSAALSLNEAIVSYLLGDMDSYNTAISRAREEVQLSESEAIYTRFSGLEALTSDDGEAVNSTETALRSFESLPSSQLKAGEWRLAGDLYNSAINSAWESGDTLGSVEYLERSKAVSLAIKRNLLSPEIFGDDLQKAYIRQVKRYRENFVSSKAKERKYMALGTSGQVELKRIRDDLSSVQSRMLSLKEKIKRENPSLIPILFNDRSSHRLLVGNIPPDEVCIIPYTHAGKSLLWIADSGGIRAVSPNNETDLSRANRDDAFKGKKVAALAMGDKSSNAISKMITDIYPQLAVKKCYSLEETYGNVNDSPSKLEGVAVLRLDGTILDNSGLAAISADTILPGSLYQNDYKMKYGWVILDGKLKYDADNPLMSYWNYDDLSVGEGTAKLHVYQLFELSAESFGVIITDSPPMNDPSSRWAIIRTILDGGFKALISLDGSLEPETRADFIRRFFAEKQTRPIEAFAMTRSSVCDDNNESEFINYYGHNGWNFENRQKVSQKWFRWMVTAGDSVSLKDDFDSAIGFYSKAEKLALEAGVSRMETNHLSRKMVEAIIRTGKYDEALFAQAVRIERAGNDLDERIFRWQEYRDIARDVGRINLSLIASNEILTIAGLLDDPSMEAESYLHLADDYRVLGEYERGEYYARESIMKSENMDDSIILAEALYALAKVEIEKGDNSAALENLKTALILFEENGSEYWEYDVLLSLGRQYNRTGRYLEGRKVLARSLGYFEDMGDYEYAEISRYDLAENYFESNLLMDARILIDEILAANPVNPDALILSAKIYRRKGEKDNAYSDAIRAVDIIGPVGNYRLISSAQENLGDIFYTKADFRKAAERYSLALEFMSRDSVSGYPGTQWYKLTSSLHKTGEPADSVFLEIMDSYSGTFLYNLCTYRMAGIETASRNTEKSREYYRRIMLSDDTKSSRILKWRSAFAMAELSDGDTRDRYLAISDSLYRSYPPEPVYIKDDYHLDIAADELYAALAETELDGENIIGAADYLERMIINAAAALHLSNGNFDKTEMEFIDTLLANKDIGSENYKKMIEDFIRRDPRYGRLWGMAPGSVTELRGRMTTTQCALRYYQLPEKTISFYIDSDTIAYNIVERGVGELKESLANLPETIRNVAKSDSTLEFWYDILIGSFEELIEEKEEVLVIPDGILTGFPFAALKRPDADFIGESYNVVFSMFLPMEFPVEEPVKLSACFAEKDGSMALGIVNRVVEATGGCGNGDENSIRFFDGDGYRPDNGYLIIDVTPDSSGPDRMRLKSLLAVRDGYKGEVRTLWEVPDQAISYFYWTYLKNIGAGEGINESHSIASSYLFGRYAGAPYYWAFNVLYYLD